MKNLLFN